jgi:hypothetical protein
MFSGVSISVLSAIFEATTPIKEFSSSIVPYASRRGLSLLTR